MPPYNPVQHGARCQDCPRKGQTPVPPVGRYGAHLCWLGQDPGENETKQLQPFVGNTGKRLDMLWGEAGRTLKKEVPRSLIWITNAALCQPVTKSDKEGREAARCCRPRLMGELARLAPTAGILAMGKLAWDTITGGETGIGKYIGFHVRLKRPPLTQPYPADLRDVKGSQWVVPVIHPAFTFRQPVMLGPLQAHVTGFLSRHLRGIRSPPEVVFNATVQQLEGLIAQCRELNQALAVDIESAPPPGKPKAYALLPGYARLRLIGVGADIGDGIAMNWFHPVPRNVWKVLKAALEDELLIKVFCNGYGYDIPVLKRYGISTR